MSLERNNISRASATLKWMVPNTTMAKCELSRAIAQERWSDVIQLVQSTPKLAKRWATQQGLFDGETSAHVLPLHEALIAKAPYEVISALIKAYPKALSKAETSFERLPLHCACRTHADLAIIKLLVESNVDSCLQVDSLGRVPIHYALTNGASPGVLKFLIDAAPLAAKSCDSGGWTPVHIACSVDADPTIVKALLKANPEAVNVRTNKGSSLQNCIARNGGHKEEIKAMIEATAAEIEPLTTFHDLRKTPMRASQLVVA